MTMSLEEEKELLLLKGDILRMKLYSQSKAAKQEVYQPMNNINLLGSALNQPVIRSLLLAVLSKKILTARNIVISGLGLAAICLLGKNNNNQ